MGSGSSKDAKAVLGAALKHLESGSEDGTALFVKELSGIDDPAHIREAVTPEAVGKLRARSALLESLLNTLYNVLVEKKDAWKAEHRQLVLCALEMASSLLLGLFSTSPDKDIFLGRFFFGASDSRKCASCGAVVQSDWKVCPYCEHRLAVVDVSNDSFAFRLTQVVLDYFFVSSLCGSSNVATWTLENVVAREAIMHFVLSTMSAALSMSPKEFHKRSANRWLDAVVKSPRFGEAFPLIVQTALTPVAQGWFSGYWGDDKKDHLRRVSLYVITIALNGRIGNDQVYYYPPSSTSGQTSSVDDEEHALQIKAELAKSSDRNFAFDHLHLLKSSVIFDQIASLLQEKPESFALGCGLFWQLVLEAPNAEFLDRMLVSSSVERLVVPILGCILDGKADLKAHGSINMALFVLLALSSRRQFGLSVNAPLSASALKVLPAKIALESSPSITDAFVMTVEQVVCSGQLEALHESLLTVLCNISPYQKTLSLTSSVALMRLFVYLSTRKFLLKTERSPDLLVLVLDSISNLLQYQYEGNRPLTYALVSYRDRFARLTQLVSPNRTPPLSLDEYAEGKVALQEFHSTAWFDQWRRQVHSSMRVICRVLDELVPLLEQIGANQADAVMQSISKTTVVGVLPPPPPIVIRKTARSKDTDVWIAKFIWSVVFNAYKPIMVVEPSLFTEE